MCAAQVVEPTGPAQLEVRAVPSPARAGGRAGRGARVRGLVPGPAARARAMYQLGPEPPFTIGIDVAGTVVSGPGLRARAAGGRRRCPTAARRARGRSGRAWTFAAPGRAVVRRGRGAADELPHRALRAAGARRRLQAGETVLVNGAAGASVPPTIQVATGYGADMIAVTSAPRRRRSYARRAGAHHTVLLDGLQGRGARADRRRGRRRRRRRRGRRRLPRLAAHPWPRRAGCWWSASPPARASPRSR